VLYNLHELLDWCNSYFTVDYVQGRLSPRGRGSSLYNERRRREGRGVEGGIRLLQQLEGLGVRCELPQRGFGMQPQPQTIFNDFGALDDLLWPCFATVCGSINRVSLGHFKA
jgi:hypothetical protein